MILNIPSLLWFYVMFPLVGVLAAWLFFVFHRRRQRRNLHKTHACPSCGKEIRVKNEVVFIRCPHCGVKLELDELVKFKI